MHRNLAKRFLQIFILLIVLFFTWNLAFQLVIRVLNVYFNHYHKTVYFPIKKTRLDHDLNIKVLVVINRTEDLEEYSLAQNTLKCYCSIFEYELEILDFSKNSTLKEICPQKDFMFQRHCAVAHFLTDNVSLDWILFLDADFGVINPNHLIEDFINPKSDLLFYQRMFNYEIMAGSYLAKRSNFTINFLFAWANSFYSLPNSFHGSDNGAIHSVFLQIFCTESRCSQNFLNTCRNLWQNAVDFPTLARFTRFFNHYLIKFLVVFEQFLES